METPKAGVGENPSPKTDNLVFAAQILFRIAATGTALAAARLIFNAEQTVDVMGMSFYAKYNYSPAFKFFASANAIACSFTFLSLFFMLFSRRRLTASIYFLFLLHDLLMTSLVLAGTAIGDGNSKTGWVSTSLTLSYVAMICLMLLTITSAAKSRKIYTLLCCKL
ncbi:CASP-like protein 1F1 [Hibiscus trionum]|uniref:CASP-like protein n=1 Tax=Hibiscus trionum TaxID=183268 RepID=A0A9W7H737_HIBTR|nr:CASP-like protein 1F1 [Hibiscus trionum]